MKLHHTEYKKNYINYLLAENECTLDDIMTRFNEEYGWCIERKGERLAMIEWLQGLALVMPCYYDDIVQLAIDMGSIDENPSEKLKDKIQENYFSFMAGILLIQRDIEEK
jgi:hypothetical protein